MKKKKKGEKKKEKRDDSRVRTYVRYARMRGARRITAKGKKGM